MAAEPGKNASLTSWKEIASYLGCDQRTCYRWEKTLGLPVHRLEGAHKSRVFAYKEELDAWHKSKENNHSLDRHKPGSAAAWKTAFLSYSRGFFPTQLAVLGSDGKLLGEFWNSGQIADFALVDLERDGRKEIIFSGMNNEYKKGCLIVFDTARISGSSPQSVERFISPGFPPGRKGSMSSSPGPTWI